MMYPCCEHCPNCMPYCDHLEACSHPGCPGGSVRGYPQTFTLAEVAAEYGIDLDDLDESYVEATDANPERVNNGCMIFRVGQS